MSQPQHTYTLRQEVGFGIQLALSQLGEPHEIQINNFKGNVFAVRITDDPLASLRATSLWENFDINAGVLTPIPAGTRQVAVENQQVGGGPTTVFHAPGFFRGAENARYYGVDTLRLPFDVLDYPALVLADMGPSFGSFFEMQDGIISPLTDTGPDASVDMIAKDPGITSEIDGPWPGSKALFNDDGIEFRDWTENSDMFDSGISGTWEGWYKVTSTGSQTFNLMLSDPGGRLQMSNSIGPIRQGGIDGPALPQPADWTALTVFASGDRRARVPAGTEVFEVEVAGTSGAAEPTWPAVGLTVVDGTVTWRNVGFRSSFHSSGFEAGGFTPTLDEWFHAAFTRDATGWKAYINGVHDVAMDILVPADDTIPGSFGTPKPFALSVDYSPGPGTQTSGQGYAIGASGVDGEEQWHGGIAFVAAHHTALTAAQIKAHFDLGVALGLNT